MNTATKKSFRRVLKIVMITCASLLALIMIVIAIAINFVFTPSKITPLIEKSANTSLNGELNLSSVELTFFSTFPHFSLEILEGKLVSNALHNDTTATHPADTLLQFDRAMVKINPMALLTQQKFVLSALQLEKPKIYAFIDSTGRANWDIMKSDSLASEADQTVQEDTASANAIKGGLDIKGIKMIDGALTYDDRFSKLYASTDTINISLDGSLTQKISDIQFSADSRNIILWQQGKLLLKRVDFGLSTAMKVNSAEKHYELNKTVLDINGLKLGAQGEFKVDTLTKSVAVDLGFGIQSPSLKTLLELIPQSLVPQQAQADANGEVTLTGSLKGIYGKDQLPVLEASLRIKDGAFRYQSMPVGVDKLDASIHTRLDFTQRKGSYLNIEEINFKGGPSTLEMNLKVDEALSNPHIQGRINTTLDFEAFNQIFPVNEGVILKGKFRSDLKADFPLNQLLNGNTGNLKAEGSARFDQTELISPADSFELKIKEAGFQFISNATNKNLAQGKSLLNIIIGFDGLHANFRKAFAVEMDKVGLHLVTSPLTDTTSIASVSGTAGFARIEASIADSLKTRAVNGKVNLNLKPLPSNKKIPVLTSLMKLDTFLIQANDNRLLLDLAGFETRSEQSATNKRHWKSTASIGFREFSIFTPALPLKMAALNSSLSLTENDIELNNFKLQIGSSDVALSGKLRDYQKQLFVNKFLQAELSLTSNLLNLNEMMSALDKATAYNLARQKGESKAEVAKTITEPIENIQEIDSSLNVNVFVIPGNIDFAFNTQINKVLFGKLEVTNAKGTIEMRNNAIRFDKMGLETLGAKVEASMLYRASTPDSAYTGFMFHMKDIRIGRITEMIPAVDTIMPMLRSFDGNVNFGVAMEAKLNRQLNIVIPSVNGAARLEGDSLVLFDGDAFRKIAKIMMFKNKDRNVVDSISSTVLIKESVMQVYPFVLQMDRYKVAIGGDYNIGNKLNYHISVLSSPVPFKLGIDITGTPDDIDFKITKAKYKNLFIPSKRTVLENKEVELQQSIRDILRRSLIKESL